MSIESLKESVRNVPDFPQKGIQFKDITTLFKSGDNLLEISEILYEQYKDRGITKIVGIESRGFILGPVLATRLKAGFVPIRKPGKLPAPVYEESYGKEYGRDLIQIHQDALSENDIILLHDDLLATGGTMRAAYHLTKRFNPKKIFINFLIELEDLKGREIFDKDTEVTSLIKYGI